MKIQNNHFLLIYILQLGLITGINSFGYNLNEIMCAAKIEELMKNFLEKNYANNETLTFLGNCSEDLVIPSAIKNLLHVEVLSKENSAEKSQKNLYVILFLDENTELNMLLDKIKNRPNWNSRAHYALIIKKDKEVTDLFETLWDFDLIYTIIIKLSCVEPKIFLASPFNNNTCGKYQNYTILTMNEKISFPVTYNFRGCSLKVRVVNKLLLTMPYVSSNLNSKEEGILQKTLNFLGNRLGLKIIYKETGLDAEIKLINKRVNMFTIFSSVVLSFVNRYENLYKLFDPTDIYFYDDYFWIIAKPSEIPNFKVLLNVFSLKIWIFQLLTFLSSLIAYTLITKKVSVQQLPENAFMLLGFSLGIGINKAWKNLSTKIFIFSYLIFAMNVSIIFQSKLSSLLANPGIEKGIETVEEMANSDVTPILHFFLKDAYKDLNYPILQKIYKKSIEANESAVKRLEKVANGRYSIPVYKCSSMYKVKDLNKIRFIGTDYLMNMEATFNLRKNSPLLDSFNFYIQNIHESGLQTKWMKDILWRRNIKNENESKKLNLGHFGGVFKLLLLGYSFGFICFVFELLWYSLKPKYFRNRKRNSQF